MGRIVDVVAPPRMGAGFRWLLASSWTSNLGDGIGLAAGPLLVASQTRNPVLLAMAALLQRLPWLLFGLWAGAIADRVDRRVLVVVADLLRALVVAVLCVSVVTGWVDVTVVLVTTFLFGVAGALLVARIATPPGAPRDLEGTHVRRDIADGLRWIRRNPPVRTLALVILAFNVT